MPDRHAAGIARLGAGRSRGNVWAVFQHRLPGLGGVRRHRGVDMEHHQVVVPRRPRIELVLERALRYQFPEEARTAAASGAPHRTLLDLLGANTSGALTPTPRSKRPGALA